jgi:O-antigen ligase
MKHGMMKGARLKPVYTASGDFHSAEVRAATAAKERADEKPPSNRISAFLLFATVAAAPLPYGSADFQTIAFWCIVLGIAAIAASPRGLQRGQFYLLGLIAVVIAAYGFVLHEQLAAHPWIATPHPLWHEVSEALGVPVEPSVSVARHQPFFALGASLANLLALICGLIVCADRKRARQLLTVIAWSGAAYAVYGIAALLIDPTKTRVTSTFIYRNAAAVLFGSCAIIWLLLLYERIRDQLASGLDRWKMGFREFLFWTVSTAALPLSMLLICLAAMFGTASRGGIFVSLIMLVVAIAASFSRDLARRRGWLLAASMGVIVTWILFEALGASVNDRLLTQGLGDEGRPTTYWSAWQIIRDNPWIGTGLGTFEWIFPTYRSAHASMWGIWETAHSTLLEIAVELGLPFAGLVVIAWIIALAVLVRGVWTRRRDVVIPMAAFCVAALSVAHSLPDFSLQIPGYSIVVFALLGAGLSQSFPSRSKGHRSGHDELSHAAAAPRQRP